MNAKLTCKKCNQEFDCDLEQSPVTCTHCGQQYSVDLKAAEEVTAPKIIGSND